MSAQGQTDALQQAEKIKYLIFLFYRLQVNSDFMGLSAKLCTARHVICRPEVEDMSYNKLKK